MGSSVVVNHNTKRSGPSITAGSVQRLKDFIRSGMTACGLNYQRWRFGSGGQMFRVGVSATGLGLQFGWRRNSEIGTLAGLRSRGIRTVLDIGANDGGFAWIAMNALPQA